MSARVVIILGLLAVGCGGGGDMPPPAGELGGHCYPNGTCNATLMCVGGVCEPEGTCGDGTVDAAESCDTGIGSGPGSCPTSCDDGQACTADALSGAACDTVCTHDEIVAAVSGDGCCPSGANASSDSDCPSACGDGFVDVSEQCDTGITTGPGACPTTCSDTDACTIDTLMDAGTCQATCTFTAITAAADGDGCCPAGENANTDNDCSAVCGNGVIEPLESCDDGGMVDHDGCSASCAQETPRLDVSVDQPTLTTELATTNTVMVTLTGSDGFSGAVMLAASLDNGSGSPMAGWTISLDQSSFTLSSNGTATATATITIPTINKGLSANAVFTATSSAGAGMFTATTQIVVTNQITIPVTTSAGQCVYPPAGTTYVSVGTKLRWSNNSAADTIVIHVGSNSNGVAHQASSPGSPPGTGYEQTVVGTPGPGFSWYCHSPGPAVSDRIIQPVDIAPGCGNQVVEGTEQCDDGNTDNTDGCDMGCRASQLACVGNAAPTTATSTITLSGTSQQLAISGGQATLQPLSAATLETCRGNCTGTNLLDTRTTAADGTFSTAAMPTGGAPLEVFLRVTKTSYRTTLLYPPAPFTANRTGIPTLSTSDAVFAFMVSSFGVTQTAGNGTLYVSVIDCADAPIASSNNLVLSVKQGGLPVTGTSVVEYPGPGSYLIFNVPPGATEIGASYFGVPLLSHTISVVGATTTQTYVRAGY